MIITYRSRTFIAGVSSLFLASCSTSETSTTPPIATVSFKDVSIEVGLVTQPNWKYGGPTVADIDNDGYYDFLLTNHDTTPVQLFMGTKANKFREVKGVFPQVDLHGTSAGDFDLDGDNDILLSLGGGNGLKPQPQRLLRNDGDKFTDITQQAGIAKLGARGRSVRWVDLDNDGDLDFVQVNAAKMVYESLPRNIIFENLGDGTFAYFSSPEFEEVEAERILLTDYNNDDVMDAIAFTSYDKTTVWKGNGDLTFSDVTDHVLPTGHDGYPGAITVAHADIDNDGDLDYYLARGKLYYTIANNSISYNEETWRLDLRDKGSKSHDGLTLYASGALTLSDFYHFPRAKRLAVMPLFIGGEKLQISTPSIDATANTIEIAPQQAQGFPEKVDKTGWYLGYVGNNTWRLEWMLADDLAWDVRASITGVSGYDAPWTPQHLAVPDVLLRNDNGVFTDISAALPQSVNSNNWGVTTADFNNDGFSDFFVYRFGELKSRVSDVMLLNDGQGGFESLLSHGATSEYGKDSHGDGGVAFDYNRDGKVDILSGDDDNGKWHLYENNSQKANGQYLLLHIGYSEKGVDPYGAKVWVSTSSNAANKEQYRLIGSSSANHSQSLLNLAHFGVGNVSEVTQVLVRWRDGTTQTLNNVSTNQLIKVGQHQSL